MLPVDVELGPLAALELVASLGAVGLIVFGFDASRSAVMVERLAVNLYEHGAVSRPLTPRGPAAMWATLPALPVRDAVRELGIPCEMSLSAGAFVSNATLYRALEAGLAALVVHLPSGLSAEDGARVIQAVSTVVLAEESRV